MVSDDFSIITSKNHHLRLRDTAAFHSKRKWEVRSKKKPFTSSNLMCSLVYTHHALYLYLNGLNNSFMQHATLYVRGYS